MMNKFYMNKNYISKTVSTHDINCVLRHFLLIKFKSEAKKKNGGKRLLLVTVSSY